MIEVIKHQIEKWRTRGAVAPSSRFLISRMISKIHFTKDLEVLQLGFGEGVFTRAILDNLKQGSHITVFEIDPKCRKHKIEDKRITYIEDSAENISKYFKDKKFDCIVSTLPFAVLSKDICEHVFEQIKEHLTKNGKFLQFQYSLYSKKEISALFHNKPHIDFELFNIPPAFIYEIKNKE